MDWSKVKSILIVALLITNLVIVVFIVFDDGSANKIADDNQAVLLEKILQDRQIVNQIAENIPQASYMPRLTMSYQLYDMQNLASALLGQFSRQNNVYYDTDYQLSFSDNKLTIKSLMPLTDAPSVAQSSDSQAVAEAFIKRYFGAQTDYQLLSTTPSSIGVSFVYRQKYQDYSIYGTAMRVDVAADRVVLLERKWMSLQAQTGQAQAVKGYHRALFSAVEQLTAMAPLTIESVDLGYRLEQTLLGEDVQSGDALPYYQFSLSNQKQIFVPALAQSDLVPAVTQ